jgi:hypothetical protein
MRNVAHRWNLKADQIDEYVDMVNEVLPLPVDPFGLQPFVVARSTSEFWIRKRARPSLVKKQSFMATIRPTQVSCWGCLSSTLASRDDRPFRYS